MATIASQVIFHPIVSQGLKFGGTTLGRDKTYRAVQYLARFLGWYYLSRGDKLDAARWNSLKAHLALARKLMRLGKPMEHLQAALKASLTIAPPAEQITTIGRQLCYFGYLAYDAIVWANAVKLVNLSSDNAGKVSKRSYRFWLAGITFSIVNGILKHGRLSKEYHRLRVSANQSEKPLGQEADIQARLGLNKTARDAARRQFIIDMLDLWLPAAALDIVQANEGVLGILGFITSVLAGMTQWEAITTKV